MPSERRPDPRGVETRAKLLDAAEQLLMEEGYASVTSRRVGARAGVAHQLVHYHFHSMDDLFVELIRRRGEAGCAMFEQMVEDGLTLTQLWDFQTDNAIGAANAEVVALANHREAVRDEIARHGRTFRRLHTAAVRRALERAGLSTDLVPPDVLTVIITATAQLISNERAIGMTDDHEATVAYVRSFLDGLETE